MTTEKEMEKKYYTPDIEEFHIGFEYEYMFGEKYKHYWTKIEFGDTMDTFRNLSDPEVNHRVKYLDREDIESLGGWEFVKEYKEPGSYYLEFKQRHTELTLYPALEETMVFIEHESATGMFEGYPIFRGQIKNKSELKVLLKQLGI